MTHRQPRFWRRMRAPDVEPRLLSLLGLVALALFFESYDLSMLTSALPYIARDLGMDESSLGFSLATIRLGALPAVLLVPLIDRAGRRRVFLASIVGTSVLTSATAFAPNQATFIVLQMLVRGTMLLGAATAFVIVTEEFPAAHRGWAIGALGALSAAGHGLGALFFSAIEVLPGGWRALYAVGALPLVFLGRFRRGVPETTRFVAQRDTMAGWFSPLRDLATTHPLRATVLTAATLLVSVGDVAAFQYVGYFALEVHGLHPAQWSVMFIMAGGVGILGNMVAGRLADRIGRRRVGATFFAAVPLAVTLYYHGPAWALPVGFAALVFCQTAGATMLRAFSTELFPTGHRGTSAGWVSLIQTLGWAAGLAVTGFADDIAGIAVFVTMLSLSVLLGGGTLLLLPETGRRELEAISEDDAG